MPASQHVGLTLVKHGVDLVAILHIQLGGHMKAFIHQLHRMIMIVEMKVVRRIDFYSR